MDGSTLFLAKVFGLYLTILSVLMLVRRESFTARIDTLLASSATLFFSAIVTLILGILLVVSHNIWIMHWTVLITILCWWVLIKGVLRLFFPEIDKKWTNAFIKTKSYYSSAVIMLVLGILFLYLGFLLHHS